MNFRTFISTFKTLLSPMGLVRILTIIVVLVAAAFSARAQSDDAVNKPPAKTYEVLMADRLVLTVRNQLGPIVGTAMLPVGSEPVSHPFLTATALVAGEENALHAILEQSSGFNDFLRRLTEADYTVRERLSK
jgi:septal ring-binding cell division protein DamX